MNNMSTKEIVEAIGNGENIDPMLILDALKEEMKKDVERANALEGAEIRREDLETMDSINVYGPYRGSMDLIYTIERRGCVCALTNDISACDDMVYDESFEKIVYDIYKECNEESGWRCIKDVRNSDEVALYNREML